MSLNLNGYLTIIRVLLFHRVAYCIFFVWLVVSLIMMLVTLIDKVVKGDTETQITVDSSIDQLPFPAITICNFNTYSKTFLARDWGDNVTSEAMRYLMEAAYEDFNGIKKIFENDTKIDRSFENVTEIFKKAAHSAYGTFGMCYFNREQRDCFAMFSTILTDYGVCFHFPGGNETDYLVRESGSKYGITVYLMARPEQYTTGVSQMSIGFQV